MNLPDVIQDRYEVERLLGRGRFAEVWLARDRRAAHALRALKIFHSGAFGMEPAEWARREFTTLKPLKHPRVVSVLEFDVMRGTGQPFYTLQVLFGDDIVTALRRLPLNEALPHIVDLCRGLEYLHFKGLVHGDLKPQNVIVDRDRGVVLTDPLLPPALQEDVLPPIYGTVGFQAPEIILREPADQRADLYSLGVILYHVLAGRSPFEARDPVDLIRLQLSRDPVDLALLDPHIPSHLCEIVSKLLKRDPTQRFDRASQVILALSRGSGREFSVETAATRAAYVSEPPLVGRDEERLSALEAMRQLASPVSERRVVSFSIVGTRGSGKSRLLAELVREATALDIEVMHTPQSDDAVLGVFRNYLERVFERVAPELPPQLSSRLQQYLAGRDDSPASPDLRAKLLAAVVTALLKAAQERALLLTVEELGSIPGPAFQLLCELLGSLQNERLMIVATASDDDLDETRGAQLKRFREEGLLRELLVKPVTEEQVGLWLDAMFERPSWRGDLALRLVESSGGKPALIMEVLNSLVGQGHISRERERWVLDPTLGDLPLAPSVASAIEQRLAQLPSQCRHLAACLAVIERPVSPAELKTLFPDLPIAVDTCLDQLTQSHLLRVAQERMVLHPSDTIKLALKHLSTDARRSLHATLLKTLSKLPAVASLAELASHAIGANDAAAIEKYAADAGREAVTRLDYEHALSFFENAVLHLTQPEERARVLFDLAGLSAAVGDMKRAITAYEQLAQLAREQDNETRLARALNGLAQVHLERGDLLEGKRVIARAGTVSRRRGDQSARLSAITTLASLLLERGEYEEARPLFGEVLRAHHASGNADAERWTLHSIARLHVCEGRLTRAFTLLEKLLAQDRAAGDEAAGGEALLNLAELRARRGDHATAEKIYLEVATHAAELGDRSLLMKAYLKLGQVYAHHGEFEQAVKWLSRARTLAITSGHLLMEAHAEDALGNVRFMSFRYHEALQHHERALSLHLQMERALDEAQALCNMAACEEALGRYERAMEHCARVIAMADVPGTRPLRAAALVQRAKLLRLLGLLDRAERDLELAFALCESTPPGGALTAAHVERGWAYLERGSTAWARTEFTRALELEQLPETMPTLLEARAGLAELGLRLGERELARKSIEFLLQQGGGAGRTRFLARAHLLQAELRSDKADPHLVESHVTDAVLLAETIADKELLREVSYRAARLRERLGHTEEALDLFRRAADLTEQLCMLLNDPGIASSFKRSNQRDRAAKAVKRLTERLSGLGTATSPLVAPTADVLLKHVLALAQCRTPEALLDRTMEAVMEIANMPLGFARVHSDNQQDLLRCIGSAEDETLHSRRLEGSFAVAERTMRTGEVLLCPDANSSPEFGELMGTSTHPLRSFLCLPLPSSQHPGSNLGVLFAADFSPRTFDQFPTTQQLLKLARAAAGHLEPLLEVQGLRRKGSTLAGENKALVTLKRTAEILAGPGELPDRLGDALVEVLEATGARQAGVVRIEGGREEILAVRTRRGARIPLGHPVSRGMLDLLLATGTRVFVEDASTSPPFRSFESVDNLKIRSAVLCPARIDGQIAAAVFADQGDLTTRSLSRDSASLLEAFSDQVGALLQNARLGRELSRSKRELEAIFEDAPFPMAALDSHFTIRAFNRAAEFETGFARGELVGVRKAHHLLSPREGGEGPIQLLRELNHTGACEGEVWMVRADGSDFLAHLDLRAMTSADGAPLGYAGIFRNITRERDAEATVQRFRHILQVLSEGVLVADAEGRITFANEAAENILEYDRGELRDKHVSLLIPPVTKPSMTDILRSAKSGAWRGEVMMLMKHGMLAPIQLSVSWVRGLDGQPRATVAIISDIRDRKRHEDELRRLSGRVITAQEEERRRLALELHDESAQALTALLLNLEFLGRITKDEEPKTQITRCAQIVRDTMTAFKRIAADLHPAVLDKFGLIPALKKQCADFAQDTGLEVSFHVKGGIDVAPGPSSTALFRIAQQALTNVARHAQAKRIAVRLRRLGNDLALTVADDGQGFVPKSLEVSGQDGIGLISMRERVAAFGGSFKIRSVPGKGTSVRARVRLLEVAVAAPAVAATQDGEPEEVLK